MNNLEELIAAIESHAPGWREAWAAFNDSDTHDHETKVIIGAAAGSAMLREGADSSDHSLIADLFRAVLELNMPNNIRLNYMGPLIHLLLLMGQEEEAAPWADRLKEQTQVLDPDGQIRAQAFLDVLRDQFPDSSVLR